jgi:hypothetical protein
MESSDLTGIYWDEDRIAWRARIFYGNRTIHVGYFETIEEAQRARDRLMRIYGKYRIPSKPGISRRSDMDIP